jgi:2-polyprenyl-6-methoxyphenol hydroxylase-like FAD-dependent oxidoreductase
VRGRIAVVGAGPAGLTAAIAARRLGLDVVVYEQAAALGQVGGGIALQSNGQRVLASLDLLASFEPRMETARTFLIEGPGGARYARVDYGALPVPFPRFAVVLRAELQQHLLHAAERAGVRIRLARRCAGLLRDRTTTALRFADGSTAEASVVLGADGTRSTVRSSGRFAGGPRSVGIAALRGVVDRPATPGVAREIWLDDGRLFGIAPLPAGRTYFYCSAPLGRWDETVGRIGTWVDSWRAAHREAGDILAAVGDWTRVTYDELQEVRAPRWSGGRCFLLGDAAHAMMPNLGQGANSAMVDALVLVRLLAAAGDDGAAIDDVGTRYEGVRRAFVRRIQRASHVAGRVATWRSPAARLVRRAMLALGAMGERVSRSGLRLGAGLNPAEERFLGPLDCVAPTTAQPPP